MHRTTIMLPEDLKARACQRAEARGISFGELVRECLGRELDRSATDRRKQDPLFRQAAWESEAPSDLAASHDRYLYDDPSEP